MRILVTNDDGIHAPGLAVLEKIARSLSDDVFIFAPETDQSGVAHSLSLNDPLRLREISPRHYAVRGTPTDCVIMGLQQVLADDPPDLVLSGVNRGQNVADDVTYSGTIAAAMEGTLLEVPSIALSQAYGFVTGREGVHWDCAATHAPSLIDRIYRMGIPKGVLINMNFPDCPHDDVIGSKITAQGQRGSGLLTIDPRIDGRGNGYYWIVPSRGQFVPEEGTDLAALAGNYISITPLHLDLTDHAVCRFLLVLSPEQHQPQALMSLLLRLRERGIQDTQVLRAVESVPRALFVSDDLRPLALRDLTLPIAWGQSVPSPFFAANMLESLALTPNHRVLEIGTGSGYCTALLSRLAGEVLSIERCAPLIKQARSKLETLKCKNVAIVWGEAAAIPSGIGAFDRIVIHSVVEVIPNHIASLMAQTDALLVCARLLATGQHLVLHRRRAGEELEELALCPSQFLPLQSGLSHQSL